MHKLVFLAKSGTEMLQTADGKGIQGVFNVRSVGEWLSKHNPAPNEKEVAMDNFARSCAGYCVISHVLGLGDRHNDNIMVKTSGHLFHIDFGKFLGDAQVLRLKVVKFKAKPEQG